MNELSVFDVVLMSVFVGVILYVFHRSSRGFFWRSDRRILKDAYSGVRVSPDVLRRALAYWPDVEIGAGCEATTGSRKLTWSGRRGRVDVVLQRDQPVAWDNLFPTFANLIDDQLDAMKSGRRTPTGLQFRCAGRIHEAEAAIQSALLLMDVVDLADRPIPEQLWGVDEQGLLTPNVLKDVLADLADVPAGEEHSNLQAEVHLTVLQLGSAPLTMVLARASDPPQRAVILFGLFKDNAPDFEEQPEALKLLSKVAGKPGVDPGVVDAALVYAAAGAEQAWAEDVLDAIADHHSDEAAALQQVLELGPAPDTAILCRERIGVAYQGGQLALSGDASDDEGAVSLATESGALSSAPNTGSEAVE